MRLCPGCTVTAAYRDRLLAARKSRRLFESAPRTRDAWHRPRSQKDECVLLEAGCGTELAGLSKRFPNVALEMLIAGSGVLRDPGAQGLPGSV